MEQRQVPPAVRGDDGRRPMRRLLVHPAHTRVGPVGHLEDMRHHVVRSRVERIQGQRGTGGIFGTLVLAAFLESEGMHDQHGVVAGHVARTTPAALPPRVRSCGRIAGEVVERIRHLQRERIARLQTQHLIEPRRGQLVVVGGGGRDRGKMQSLALVGPQARGANQQRARPSNAPRIATAHEQPGLQHVRHHEAGRLPQRRRKLLVGAAVPALERGERTLVGLRRRQVSRRRRGRWSMGCASSASGHRDHDFGVLARHHQATAAADVEFVQQRRDVARERRLAGRIQRAEGLVGRAVVVAEHLQEVRGRAVAEREELPLDAQVARVRTEQAVRLASAPQSAGERTPAGGGTCAPMILNRRPMKPSGVQLAMPMRPPGRTTRSISRAALAWSGANITPKVDSTTSKLAAS